MKLKFAYLTYRIHYTHPSINGITHGFKDTMDLTILDNFIDRVRDLSNKITLIETIYTVED